MRLPSCPMHLLFELRLVNGACRGRLQQQAVRRRRWGSGLQGSVDRAAPLALPDSLDARMPFRRTAWAIGLRGRRYSCSTGSPPSSRHRYFGAPVHTIASRESRWRDRPPQVGRHRPSRPAAPTSAVRAHVRLLDGHPFVGGVDAEESDEARCDSGCTRGHDGISRRWQGASSRLHGAGIAGSWRQSRREGANSP
jgi:hypothetical protein